MITVIDVRTVVWYVCVHILYMPVCAVAQCVRTYVLSAACIIKYVGCSYMGWLLVGCTPLMFSTSV